MYITIIHSTIQVPGYLHQHAEWFHMAKHGLTKPLKTVGKSSSENGKLKLKNASNWQVNNPNNSRVNTSSWIKEGKEQ